MRRLLLFPSIKARRDTVVAGALGVSLLANGCGASQRVISATATLSVLRRVGFTNLGVRTNRQFRTTLIFTPGFPVRRVEEMPIQAAVFPTVSAAKERVTNDQLLLLGHLSPADRAILPQGFRRARLREVRVCNVVLDSYDAGSDPALAGRFDRAVGLMKKWC